MTDRDGQAVDAAKLYYLRGLSQNEVADELGVSRPTVSKLIQHARDRGWVNVTIHDPRETSSSLRDDLRAAYGLDEVELAVTPSDDPGDLLRHLGMAGARLVQDLVNDGDLIGLSWGETMYAVAKNLTPKNLAGVEIIQLKGGASYSTKHTNDVETIQLFCKAFNAFGRFLPLPVIFDNVEVKALVERETHMRTVIDLGRKADTAIFTVGAVAPSALLFNLGYLSEDEKSYLLDHAVGDICSRFYDADGRICMPELDERTVGLTFDELREKPRRVMVAGGAAKLEAIEVALRAGFATHFVTDQTTATQLVGMAERR